VNVIYVKEEEEPNGVEGIEWFLVTNEEAGSAEDAYQKADLLPSAVEGRTVSSCA
jgi:hypothetical protein